MTYSFFIVNKQLYDVQQMHVNALAAGEESMYMNKAFINRIYILGRILSLATAIIISTTSQNVVRSTVDDILPPPCGFIFTVLISVI